MVEQCEGTLSIRWYGHSCFLITTGDGLRILTDPFDDSIGYEVPSVEADVVTVSHDHYDHNNVSAAVGDPRVLRGAGEWTVRGAKFRGIDTPHDDVGGAKRGRNTVFVIEAGGLRLCHLGDLGAVPGADVAAAIGRVDVLMAPVGGIYTIDAGKAADTVALLSPKIVIPMHYRTRALKFKLSGPEAFLEKMPEVERAQGVSYQVSADTLPRRVSAVVMNYE